MTNKEVVAGFCPANEGKHRWRQESVFKGIQYMTCWDCGAFKLTDPAISRRRKAVLA